MKYLLIDTNVWIEIQKSSHADQILKELELQISLKKVVIVVPSVLVREWERHLSERRQQAYQSNLSSADQLLKKYSPVVAEQTKQFAETRKAVEAGHIGQIQSLIDKAIKIEVKDATEIEVGKRYRNLLPPFHNNSSSHNDAYLYFSTVEYCRLNGIPEFYFFSRNHKEFSHPERKNQIHPELIVDDVFVHFYWEENGIERFLFPDGIKTSYSPTEDFIFCHDHRIKDLHILEQWHRSLSHYYGEIDYIPNQLLAAIYPHKSYKKRGISTYSSGTLFINNDALVDFLTGVKITGGEVSFVDPSIFDIVPEADRKIKEIFHWLLSNQVSQIEHKGRNFLFTISGLKHETCTCIRCRFKRLDHLATVKLLKYQPVKDLDEDARYGYVHYQYGNYHIAIRFYFSLYKHYKESGTTLKQYIAASNIVALSALAKLYGQNIDDEVLFVFDDFDLRGLARTVADKDDFNRELTSYLEHHKFFDISRQRLNSIVEDIEEQYNAQFAGSHSTNNRFENLVYSFENLIAFYEANSIIGTRYSDQLDLTKKVFSGFLMIHRFNQYQEPKLLHFSDYLILLIANHARAKDILETFYGLLGPDIIYQPQTGGDFIDILVNNLKNYHKVLDEFKNRANKGGIDGPYVRLNNDIAVLMTIAAVSKLSAKDVDRIVLAILDFLKMQPKLYRNGEGIDDFIGRKGVMFSRDQMQSLVKLVLLNPAYHSSDLVDGLANIVQSFDGLFENDPVVSGQLLSVLNGDCEVCRLNHSEDLLPHFFTLLSQSDRKKMASDLDGILDAEFKPDKYYQWAIFGLIDYQRHFQAYCKSFMSEGKVTVGTTYLTNKSELVLPKLNDFLNLCFLYDIPIPELMKKRYTGITDYYDWLLDLNGFDYTKFKVEWIMEYSTDAYCRKIFNNVAVCSYLRDYFKHNDNSHLTRTYFFYNETMPDLKSGT